MFLHTSLFVVRTYNMSWQCTNLEHKCAGNLFGRVRPVVPPCDSGARVLRLKFRNSWGDSKVLLLFFFFFFATECASICRVGSFPTPFSRACVACGFSDIVTHVCLRRCWTFTVHVTRHLDAMETVFWCALASCVHCVAVGIVGDCSVFIEPGCFVSLTMGCVVVTEPFDLTSLVERRPLTVPNRIQTHIGNICEPTRVGTVVM